MSDIKKTFMSVAETIRFTSLSRSTIQRQVVKGLFPQSIQLTQGRMAFLTNEVERHVEALIAGVDEDGLKALVSQMVTERGQNND